MRVTYLSNVCSQVYIAASDWFRILQDQKLLCNYIVVECSVPSHDPGVKKEMIRCGLTAYQHKELDHFHTFGNITAAEDFFSYNLLEECIISYFVRTESKPTVEVM